MATDAYPKYPPDISQHQANFLLSNIKEWSISHGLAVRPASAYKDVDPEGSMATTAPVTLFPSLFPLNAFNEALELQTAYNELYANVAMDEDWLEGVVSGLVDIDDFIKKLWDVHIKVKKDGYVQDLSLGLFRSDYMVHMVSRQSSPDRTKATIRQVEFNTIASSFGGLSSRVCSLHRYLLQTAAYPREAATVVRPELLPTNASIESLAAGLYKAHTAYGPSKSERLQCVIFIVQEKERNVFDQKHIEYALFSHSRVKAFRVPFDKVLEYTHLSNEQDRHLIYTPPAFPDRSYEVTVVYFRAGYSPDEYASSAAWEARLHLERSAAIKCPSVLTHLAGTKKVQQILATPGSKHVERFLPYEGVASRLKETFAPMYPLDTSEAGQEGRKLALNPETAKQFVLKPQREGGGNNIYRSAIPEFLSSISEHQWPAYILMEMIEPPAQQNSILRNGEVQKGGVICELGVYGTCLWRNGSRGGGKGEVLANDEAGYLLRTKGNQSEEGGVAAGFGAVDSACLIDV
ncbi:MAG: hypothetical protein M1828_001432 [Chrysothrix sp. TS-e1954]|nr:MAG: hypothetical protein M1828_001432 [Chrysothrix sp. TS-e1954]